MLALVVSCLILSTSVLATGYGPYENQQLDSNFAPASQPRYPMDYNDNFGVKPGSNIIFSFEQLRRDQPPQVEMRDEDIGRYMHRKPKTTTTSAPVISRFNDFSVSMPLPSRVQPQAQYPEVNNQQWNQIQSTTMLPPPPPPSPKWMDLEFSRQHYSSQFQPSYDWNAYVVSTPVPTRTIQWSDPTRTQEYNRQHILPTPAPQYVLNSHSEDTSSTATPHWTEIAAATESFVHSRPQSTHGGTASRGSHKFNWNDQVATEALRQTIAPAPQKNGPPPSIPTLTPWYGDNFGK